MALSIFSILVRLDLRGDSPKMALFFLIEALIGFRSWVVLWVDLRSTVCLTMFYSTLFSTIWDLREAWDVLDLISSLLGSINLFTN